MNQQINLYQPALFERQVPFSARTIAVVLAVVLGLGLVAGAVSLWRVSALKSELVQLQERQENAVERIAEFERRFPPRKADPVLVRKVEGMLGDRQARLALLELLTHGQPGNSRGFSSHLEGLARETLATVWLRRIRFSAGGDRLLMEGSATSAADVPLYLQRLTRQQDYAGREFEHLQLSRSEERPQIIDFLLQTVPEEQP
jgi:hypothetical protein